MKRKSGNTSKKNTNKRQKPSRNCDQIEAGTVGERRGKEIFEIVAEENRLASEVSKNDAPLTVNSEDQISPETEVPANDAALTTNNEDDLSPEAQENDPNNIDEDTKNFQLFVHKEKQKTVKEHKVLSREKVKLALSILKEKKQPKNKASKEEKRFAILKKHCNKNVWHLNTQEPEHTWDSAMYIIKNIRICILTRNWDNVTQLLLMLLKHRKAYIPYITQVAMLNFICNPASNGEMLEEFMELLGSPKPTTTSVSQQK